MGVGRNAGGVMLRGPLSQQPDLPSTPDPVIDPAEGGLRVPASYTMTPVEQMQQSPTSLGPEMPPPTLTPPPSPYAPGQAESMEPDPQRFAPGPTETQRGLLPVWDEGRRIVGYVQQAAQPVASFFDERDREMAEAVANRDPGAALATVDRTIRPAADAVMRAAESLPGPVRGIPNPVPIVRAIANPGGGAAGQQERMSQINAQAARDQGRTDFRSTIGSEAVLDPGWRAANPELAAEYDELEAAFNMTVGLGTVGDAGRFVNGRWINDTVPTAESAASLVDAAGAGIRAAGGAIRSGARAVGASAEGLGTRVTEGMRANQGRVAALDAQMAQQGSTAAPGVFGISGVTPDTPGVQGMRPRVVPPEVADTLDFPVRIPEDPRAIRAIEAAGGSIDPERGVTLHVTRAQGAQSAGGVATRGGVFYEAVPEGGRSSFATASDDPTGVGGSQVIPRTPTRFRSPLILEDAPGTSNGFNDGMQQLVATDAQKPLTELPDWLSLIRDRNKPGLEWGVVPVDQTHGKPWAGSHATQEEAIAVALRRVNSETRPDLAREIDLGITQSRRAGPEGSPQRAQALKDLVTRYGGDPALIDDLLTIRGADASESSWAIKENILAAHARRQGYDGVITVQHAGPDEAAVYQHPKTVAAQAKLDEANQAYEQAMDEYQARQGALLGEFVRRPDEDWGTYWNRTLSFDSRAHTAATARAEADPGVQAAKAAMERAQEATNNIEAAYTRTLNDVRQELGGHKITELVDVREGRNPTPGALNPKVAEREAAIDRIEQITRDVISNPGRSVDESNSLLEELSTLRGRIRDLDAEMPPTERQRYVGEPGYTLRSDIPRRGGSTDAAASAGVLPQGSGGTGVLGAVNRGVGEVLAGGTGGAIIEQARDPDDPNAAARGFAMGAVGFPAASRIARVAARAAGRSVDTGGALATFGGVPPKPVSTPAQSANPNIRNVARMMSGQYQPKGEARSLGEQIAAALTDRYAIHANVPKEARARLLAAGGQVPVERLADRVRENPNSIAAQRNLETLAPALQSVGKDDEWMAQFLMHRHNLDIAKGKAQDAYDEAIKVGRTPQRAQQIADRVRQSRVFSGGMTEQDIIQALSDIQTEMGPARFKTIVDASQAFWDSGRMNLQRKVDEGIIDQADFTYWTQKYPHYVRTDIADYAEKGPANPSPGGKVLGIGNTGIKALSIEGTAKDRINPIMSSIDAVYATEGAISRNKAARDLVAVRDADPETAKLFKEVAPDVKAYRANHQTMVPPDYTLRGGEQKMTQWENGAARQFVIPQEYGQLLNPNPGALLGDTAAPVRTFFGLIRAGLTTHNPLFQYTVSPLRDAGDFSVSAQTTAGAAAKRPGASNVENAAREAGGAVASIPEAVGRYFQAVPQVMEGLLSNTYGPRVAELRRAGMGFDPRPAPEYRGRMPRWLASPRDTRAAMEDLKRTGGVQVSGPGDVARIIRNGLSLYAERVGSRLELLSRVAAANMERARGGDPLSQSIAGKDATVDFLRGGWLTRQVNAVDPFLNVTTQSAAQNARLYRKSPAAFTAALITTVGIPALLAEAWNRSDPERAKAYEDRPDYLKNTGIIWEMPSLPQGTGALKEAMPNYVWQPLGNYGWASRVAREALGVADSVTGLIPETQTATNDRSDPRYWAGLGVDILSMFSPVKGGDAGSAVASLIPPVASELVELSANRDFYRGSTIATDRADERVSNLSKTAAGIGNAITGREDRPSQYEHMITGPTGYAGQIARAVSDIGREKDQTRPIQDIPVVGGMAGRLIRDSGGQRLQDERDAAVTSPAIRQALKDAGLRSDEIGMPSSNIRDMPITRQEQAQYQRDFNALLDQKVRDALGDPDWKTSSVIERDRWLKNLATRARQEAAGNVVGEWDDPTYDFRTDKRVEKRTGVK
jgi:hypothetical protein